MPWLENHRIILDFSAQKLRFPSGFSISYHQGSKTALPQKKTPEPRPKTVLNISQVNAAAFDMLRQEMGNEVFAMSLRDIDRQLEPDFDRSALAARIIHVKGSSLVIPKDAEPRDYLPPQYHEYLDVFDKKLANVLPPHREWDHAIELKPGTTPPHVRARPMSLPKLQLVRQWLDDNLEKGFIRLSRSPAVAPVLFVEKPGGGLRFCVDYQGLNELTIRNQHSMPLITETLSRLSKARFFTKIDIMAAFNKLRIKEGDEWKTAFTTRYGLFESLVLPFGLCNGPASFQAYINNALAGFLDDFATAFVSAL